MIRLFAPALLILSIAAGAYATEPQTPATENTEPAPASTAVTPGVSVTRQQSEPCIDNPRFNFNNDEDGPRASSDETMSSPYASTPLARQQDRACR